MRIALALLLIGLTSLGLPGAIARAAEPMRLAFHTYAVGVHVADAEAVVSLGPWTYQAELGFHTVGIVDSLYRSRHRSAVHGKWHDDRPEPVHYAAHGFWRGEPRDIEIDYEQREPLVRQLQPPLEPTRDPVPPALRQGSTDALSAFAAMARTAAATGRCESTARTFDGRRAAEMTARTGGFETLDATSRTSFAGASLRCDFESRMLAGFNHDESSQSEYRPLRGSAWLARLEPDGPPIPVRMSVETRWLGHVTFYLTAIDGATTAVTGLPWTSGR